MRRARMHANMSAAIYVTQRGRCAPPFHSVRPSCPAAQQARTRQVRCSPVPWNKAMRTRRGTGHHSSAGVTVSCRVRGAALDRRITARASTGDACHA